MDLPSAKVHVILPTAICILLLGAAGPLFGAPYDIPGYIPREDIIYGEYYGLGPFKDPEDLFVDGEGRLWVADTGNDRVLRFDLSSGTVAVLGREDGVKLNQPRGIFVDEDMSVYVADSENGRILKFDPDGKLMAEYGRPPLPIPDRSLATYSYKPRKLAVDRRGYIYAVVEYGDRYVVVLDDDGRFVGFLAKSGKREDEVYSPSNIFIDSEGFIYVSTRNRIKKFSYQGEYVRQTQFVGRGSRNEFEDVLVDGDGNVFAIDTELKTIEKFDRRGKRLFSFGPPRDRKGLFAFYSALAMGEDGRLYVLDSSNSYIQIFEPTEFAGLVDDANRALADEKYEEAVRLWKEVIKLNSFFDPAHVALGETYLRQNRWIDAMREFDFVKDRFRFSGTLRRYRRDYVVQNLGVVLLWAFGGAVSIGGGVHLLRLAARSLEGKGSSTLGFLRQSLKMLLNPVKGLEDMRGRSNPIWSIGTLTLFCIGRYFHLLLLNPLFRGGDVEARTLLVAGVTTSVFWLSWSISCYGVGEIFDGEAYFKDILASTTFCLIPYILFSVPVALISRVLVLEEKKYLLWMNYSMYAWVALLLFLQVRTLQRFSNTRALLVSLLSALGVGIVLGAFALVYGINSQMVNFVRDIAVEIYNKTL